MNLFKTLFPRRITKYILFFFLLVFINLVIPHLSYSQWEFIGSLSIPSYPYSFITTSPKGDLIVATFNNAESGTAPILIPTLFIKNPTSSQPEVVTLCTDLFEAQKGYSGIACDEAGYIYISGDTGKTATCFIKKFNSDGELEISFGTNGTIFPRRRCLGIDVMGDYLLLVVDWGVIQIYHSRTGKFLDSLGSPEAPIYIRDIAIDLATMKIYGVSEGSVIIWEDGTPWQPDEYKIRHLTPTSGSRIAGEGIFFDPVSRSAIISPVPGNTMMEVFDEERTIKTVLSSVKSSSHFSDTTLSFDSSVIFITDITSKQIHAMRRSLVRKTTNIDPSYTLLDTSLSSPSLVSKAPSSQKTDVELPIATSTPLPVTWHRSYTQIVESASWLEKPMLLYFRQKGIPKCEELEGDILLSAKFNDFAHDFICVYEELANNPLIGFKFGVDRVPHIIILDQKGNFVARFSFDIDQDTLFKVMESIPQK